MCLTKTTDVKKKNKNNPDVAILCMAHTKCTLGHTPLIALHISEFLCSLNLVMQGCGQSGLRELLQTVCM